MSHKHKKHHHNKIRRNPTALIAALIVAFSAFLPLLSSKLFGESFDNPQLSMVNVFGEILSKPVSEPTLQIPSLILVISFAIILVLYSLNGLGLVFNRYSMYASFLTVPYLFAGLYIANVTNSGLSNPFLGNTLASVSIGPGIYLVPLVGLFYIIFRREINWRVHI